LVEVTKDSEEIKAVFKSYQDCLNHGSTQEALALYAPDVSRSFYLYHLKLAGAKMGHVPSVKEGSRR
jgi:hypothetical protein